MKRIYTLHPYLFTIYGVLALIVNNITEISISSLRVIFFSALACSAILLLSYLILRDTVKASLISSAAVLLIFLYGHVKSIIQASSDGDPKLFIFLLALAGWMLFISWIYVILKLLKTYETLSKYFTTVSLILLVFPLYSLFGFSYQWVGKDQYVKEFLQDSWAEYGITGIENEIAANSKQPDIYYIIFDSYARSDVLKELYGYDNSAFDKSLETRGFYVASQSRSNYSHTAFSLGSSMNLFLMTSLPEYLDRGPIFNKEWLINETTIDVLQSNRLMEILRQQGYQIVSFDTGFEAINFPNADYHMVSPTVDNSIYSSKNFFEIFFLDTFIGNFFKKTEAPESDLVSSMYDAQRTRITYSFDNIDQFAGRDGNYFVFAHIIAPHPPYVFGANGEEIGNDSVFTLDDVAANNRDYKLYVGEIQYLNTLIIEMVDRIIAESNEPPIIIIQGDHGSRLYPDDNNIDEIADKVLFPILNAYYLPGVDVEAVLYPTISPVNSFRIVLNNYFGANLELIEDTSFDWDRSTNYEFVPVCKDTECLISR